MAKEAFVPSSRWSMPGVLVGVLVASVSACFGLSESDYNHGANLGASGNGGAAGTSTGAGTGGSTAGSLGSSGSVGNGGGVGNAGNQGNAGSVASGGSAGTTGSGGNAGAGGSAAGQSGAAGQGGGMASCPANPTIGTGTGVKGEYFSTQDLTGAVTLTRTDAQVDFDWGAGSPGSTVPVDHFSVRWTGQVQPLYTGTYTFTTVSDDGSRVFVDSKTVVDSFVDQGGNMENTGQIDLIAGQKYALKVEYYDNAVNALIHMSWESNCQTKEVVPTTQLYPQ